MPAAPLLITASFDPGKTPQVALRNVEDRIRCHMEGLLAWLKDPGIGRIVFAKNCRVQIRKEVLLNLAVEHGKELEFLQADPSPRTVLQGKGFGEGDLIRQVLDKSEVLRASRDFIKITGKLFMPNVAAGFTGEGEGEFFITTAPDATPVFPLRYVLRVAYRSASLSHGLAQMRRIHVPWEWIAALPSGWIDTRCYRSDIGFYREYLLDSHVRVQDELGYSLENAFFDDLHDSKKEIRLITAMPIIVGMSGTLATLAGSFSDDLQREACDLTNRLLSC